MNDREYLRSLGFTVGERGRFGKEMLEALASRNNDTIQSDLDTLHEYLGVVPKVPLRPAQELYGYTVSGAKVGFIMCSSCSEHMIWCECDYITAPDNVAALGGVAKDLAKLHPRMVQLTTVN
jgi:hypothetical protein